MKNITREDIHILSRHSDMTEQELNRLLKNHEYNDKEMWKKFLRLFFITLGIGFATAGIIFFFAYNWADLNKFFKLGIVEVLLVTTTIVALIPKINENIRNIILTGASVLVGVLFAVFGQIYQTGANAYDFFLAWTLFVALWVFISNFAPLWMLFLVLVNTTFILYTQQVAKDWDEILIATLLLAFNSAILTSSCIIQKPKQKLKIPLWFTHILALAIAVCATIGMTIVIFDDFKTFSALFLCIVLILYPLGIWHGLKSKSGFYLSVIPFSMIIMITSLLFKFSDDGSMFFFATFFVIGSVTMVVINLIHLQKKWKNEN
ncbi:DUF2157 domain-containing protein [Chryseobacterium aahli]|uniref:DUF2157 domain-containing protein n=1 Tax=Chryseobacterium aahli TaxID=1278643 RepID=UPI001F607FB7|nr:DUF2157 domain-containing protein [Chryseobacterium aahli]MCI3938949.1 DUF2157 domain-containing protein [Chryseobacterium aahli]